MNLAGNMRGNNNRGNNYGGNRGMNLRGNGQNMYGNNRNNNNRNNFGRGGMGNQRGPMFRIVTSAAKPGSKSAVEAARSYQRQEMRFSLRGGRQ
ncbi:MAG: hypothetical protein CMO74_12125 [Verrucomicrobiales bacterium]|nr:hypothetical protein [Verrucomicrobiales bacterium]|tara:strand:- start:127 stop:408 length:282 start_codon:yes stop_codon:yes gene_type:complete